MAATTADKRHPVRRPTGCAGAAPFRSTGTNRPTWIFIGGPGRPGAPGRQEPPKSPADWWTLGFRQPQAQWAEGNRLNPTPGARGSAAPRPAIPVFPSTAIPTPMPAWFPANLRRVSWGWQTWPGGERACQRRTGPRSVRLLSGRRRAPPTRRCNSCWTPCTDVSAVPRCMVRGGTASDGGEFHALLAGRPARQHRTPHLRAPDGIRKRGPPFGQSHRH